ncbi:hypothetical protein WJX84_006578 [Apatococcus fuscideae]|uniref:Uncharacterized protein n=1 Tax=Apatococcus fuscideae TaxID=2026836 RepID=A0AAW1RPB0_9CHLO
MREAYTTRKASLKLADWYTAGILCRMLIIWATNRAEREPTDAEVQAMYTRLPCQPCGPDSSGPLANRSL